MEMRGVWVEQKRGDDGIWVGGGREFGCVVIGLWDLIPDCCFSRSARREGHGLWDGLSGLG